MSGVDGSLKSWDDIKNSYVDASLIMGNGASRAIWDDFGYDSLFKIACSDALKSKLDDDDKKLFDVLGTTNFETVLAALRTAETACGILQVPQAAITSHYARIQNSLAEAIKHSHIKYSKLPSENLKRIRLELRRHQHVFSLNYDLIIYWAIMAQNEGKGFVDFFLSGGRFDPENSFEAGRTRVYYLHGALHLYRTVEGKTLKRPRVSKDLLSTFGTPYKNAVPLIVTEGSAGDKQRVIGQSDYLQFGVKRLGKTKGPLVLFGVSLQDSDKHIIDAIASIRNMKLAVGIFASSPSEAKSKKLAILKALDGIDTIDFFASQSHPLGSPDLIVTKV